MSGALIRRDLTLAREAYRSAGALGDEFSRAAYMALLMNGAGGRRNWPEVLRYLAVDPKHEQELTILKQMNLDAEGEPQSVFSAEILDNEGLVHCFRSFLSRKECAHLVNLAKPTLQPSLIVDPETGHMVANPIRSSEATSFPFVAETAALHAINRRIAFASKTQVEQAEPTQILHYREKQEYRLHLDALPKGTSNQRLITFLIYLNDSYTGGETVFPELDLSFRGSTGDAIMFRNLRADELPDSRLVHAGSPVLRGQKYLLSKWVRVQPLDLSGPPGRPF